MEGDADVQGATEPTTGAGGSEGTIISEPTAQASEPVEASAEPTQSAEPVAQAVESFPEADSFGWDKWDGSTYEEFPETFQPWATKITEHHTGALNAATQKHTSEVDYWKRMYEAMSYGEEDPRIAEYTTKMSEAETQQAELQTKYDSLNTEVSAEREAENTRYFAWFEKEYEGKLENLATAHGAEKAEALVIDLMDLGLEVHTAVEVALMGEAASNTAKDLAAKVQDPSLVLEILKNRYPQGAPPQVAKNMPSPEVMQKQRTVNPATSVVAGSAPVSRPTQLSREQSPTYGEGGKARTGALMAAAENAIRKARRR